ncbi:MAG: outer membrane beta-barrel family protein [Flavobacteriaceae bacterium]|jgi:hypothetical protein|nr:outer membrane beta-barrel family protein [Flavobacteriaceae bacterium]
MQKICFFLLILFSAILYSQERDTLKTTEIKAVELKGKKKPIEQTNAGILLNVAGTALENKDNVVKILKFAPNVSQTDGLKVLGSDRIQIFLNGKEVKIKPENFNTFLSSIDAKSVKNIEIKDRPDASFDSKYDAQIAITTKTIEGIDASLGVGTSYRTEFGQSSDASFLATFGKLKVYASGDFFQAYTKTRGNNILKAEDILQNGIYTASLKRRGYNGTFNLDYDFNEKHNLSFLYDYTVDEDLDKNYNYEYTFPNVVDSLMLVKSRFEGIDKAHTFSLQYVFKPNEKKDDKLTINTDYAIVDFGNPTQSVSDFYKNNVLLNTSDITQNGKLSYHIFTASADYSKILNEKNSLNFGVKFSNSANKNILDYYDFDIFSNENSQNFNLYENIYSAYLKYTLKSEKFTYNLGLRNEYTENRFSTNKGFGNTLNYNQFLPSATINYAANKDNSIYLSLSKGMSRPDFFYYDPTVFFSPPNIKSSGNESLKPVESYRVQAGYTFKNKYSAILQYVYSEKNIVTIPRLLDDGVIFTKPENAGYQNQLLLNFSVPIKFAKFWESYNRFNFIYLDFRLPQTSNFYKSFYFSGESTQSFTLPADISLDLSFSYTSPFQSRYVYVYGNFLCSADISIPIWDGNAQIGAAVYDIFNTQRTKYYSDINGIYQFDYSKYHSREFSLSFTYYFRSGKEVDDISRDTEIQEILDRAGK